MGRDRAAILAFFNQVMDKSPLPVMIYNFPYVFPPRLAGRRVQQRLTIRGAASGIDLSSDELIQLAEHPNCFGAKVSARKDRRTR